MTSIQPKLIYTWRRTTGPCRIMGNCPLTKLNRDHRIGWIATELERQERYFAVDLVTWTATERELHQILRLRPDHVIGWDDMEVANRWARICPSRKHSDGTPREPSEQELIALVSDSDRLSQIRKRLSDSSWWMRLMCQRIAQWSNLEDRETGYFWCSNHRTYGLDDVAALKVCEPHFDSDVLREALNATS